MEQRDLIKDQIEQLGKVLGKLLADLLGFKSNDQLAQGIEITSEQLQSKLDINIDDLLVLSKDELKKYLVDRKFTSGHFEALGAYLGELGEIQLPNSKSEVFLSKALELLDLEDEFSKTASFERMNLRARLEQLLV